jgi:hypothetical protein
MVVVAAGLVREARSKSVVSVARREPASYVKWPKDLSATRRSRYVTAMEAAEKAREEIASSRIEKAEEKVWSCWSWAGARVGNESFRGDPESLDLCGL